MKKSIVFAVAALTACQQADSKESSVPGSLGPHQLKVSSKVADLRIVPTTKLPANSKPEPVPEYCSAYAVAKPKTSGGKLAAANGWIVTSETKLGTYDTVTFVGALDQMTSGTCVHRNGNLAVFDGPRLMAIAYEPEPPEGTADPDDLATIDSLGVAGQIGPRRIRLYWGLPSPPFADVVLRNGIFIEQTAKEDRVCGGAAGVPNIYNEDIRQARKKLSSYGWLPVKPPPEEGMTGGEDLVRRGVIEVEACSGTGYGFCAFNYEHKKRFGLRVISAGEDYHVTGYEVHCGGSGQKRADD